MLSVLMRYGTKSDTFDARSAEEQYGGARFGGVSRASVTQITIHRILTYCQLPAKLGGNGHCHVSMLSKQHMLTTAQLP